MKELTYELTTSADHDQPLSNEDIFNVKNIISDLEKYNMENSNVSLDTQDELGLIIQKAGSHRLLTPQEEKDLTFAYSRTSEEINYITDKLNNSSDTSEALESNMTENTEYSIEENIKNKEDLARLQELQELSKAIKDHLVNSNLRLVINLAKKNQSNGVSLPDLIQEGTIGLMRSIDKFDPHKGFRLSTYSTWWIKQSITRYIHNNSRMIRLPVHVSELATKLSTTHNRLIKEGNEPSNERLANELDVSTETVKKGLDAINISRVGSLNRSTQFSDDMELINIIPDENVLEADAEKNFLIRDVNEKLKSKLNEQQIYVIKELFGFEDKQPKSIKEIADTMGIKTYQAAKIRNDALNLLKLHSDDLKDYVN